jgi:preprotein translocase subunit SecG
MDPTLSMILGLLMRWVHIMSVVLLIGGIFYARGVGAQLASSFASKIYWLVAALVISGLYNFLTKGTYPPHYHMWFGIKMLLVLHALSMLILLTRPSIPDAKRARWMTSIMYSGSAIIAVSAVLRWLTLNQGTVRMQIP